MDYYSVIKRNEVIIHAITWLNLENTLSGKTVTKYHILYDSIYTNYNNGQTDRESILLALGKMRLRGDICRMCGWGGYQVRKYSK